MYAFTSFISVSNVILSTMHISSGVVFHSPLSIFCGSPQNIITKCLPVNYFQEIPYLFYTHHLPENRHFLYGYVHGSQITVLIHQSVCLCNFSDIQSPHQTRLLCTLQVQTAVSYTLCGVWQIHGLHLLQTIRFP